MWNSPRIKAPSKIFDFWSNAFYWLIWHLCRWACTVMNCPSCGICAIMNCLSCGILHCHRHGHWRHLWPVLATGVITETSYLAHICTYALSIWARPQNCVKRHFRYFNLNFLNMEGNLNFVIFTQWNLGYYLSHIIFYVHTKFLNSINFPKLPGSWTVCDGHFGLLSILLSQILNFLYKLPI